MVCVCGHDLLFHVETPASVPLKNPNPIYGIPKYAVGNCIANTYPNSTYVQQLCFCGCSVFEPLGA